MFTLDKKESVMYELQHQLNALKMEIRNAENWIEKSKDTVDFIQDALFDAEEIIFNEKHKKLIG